MSVTQNNLYGLIGSPLGHSISPQIHERLFELSGLSADYSLYEIKPDELESKIDFLKTLKGFNITIPHKRAIMPYLLTVSERAKRCGAVNTVKRTEKDLCGYNTDAEGFLRALTYSNINLTGNVLLCGTGGVARMMACEALARGCALTVADRHIDKAKSAKADFEKLFKEAEIIAADLSKISGPYDVILNGTPAGMYPNTDSCAVDENVILSSGAVFDAVGNPCETKLCLTAKNAGIKAAGGLRMLVYQAVAAHEIWTGSEYQNFDIEKLYDDMYKLTVSRFQHQEVL